MESDLDVDDPSSHKNELLAETWFFQPEITVRLKRLFRCLRHLQAAVGAQPFNCLSQLATSQLWSTTFQLSQSFCGLHARTAVLKIQALNNVKALCTIVPRTKFKWEC